MERNKETDRQTDKAEIEKDREIVRLIDNNYRDTEESIRKAKIVADKSATALVKKL